MSIRFRSLLLSPKAIWTYLVEIFLLLISVYGFGRGAHGLMYADGGFNFASLALFILLGVTPLLAFIFIAVYRSLEMAQFWASADFQFRIDELQKRMNEQDDFFQMINKNTTSTLAIFDDNDAYWFVNNSAARKLGLDENDIVGKKPAEVLGFERGRKLVGHLHTVRQYGQPFDDLDRLPDERGRPCYMQTNYRPLAPFEGFPGGVMARGENVTTLMIERERREAMLKQTLAALVAVVDRRDPYAAGHSSRVGQLSLELANELKLNERDCEAAEIAGSLMNFGKVLISRSILTKTESLLPEELQRIRDGILTSADILSLIDFNAPVVPTLRQVLERFDGTGAPDGLKGENILITARIVAVANALVALVSPRAYRPGLEYPIALQLLAKDAGLAFDPRVVDTLKKVLDTNAVKFDWLAAKKTD